MKNTFEDLLTAQRVRNVWGRSVTPENAAESLKRIVTQIEAQGTALGAEGETAVAGSVAGAASPSSDPEFPELPDLAEVPIAAPHHLLKELEEVLAQDLGQRRSMIRNIIEPLRVRIHRVDPTAGEADYHPLRHAGGGSIEQLMNRLEDALAGLRRVKGNQ